MDIFIINVDSLNNIDDTMLNSYKKRKFKNEKQEKIHAFTYLMLDRILNECYGVKKTEINFSNRKPYLVSREKYFSLSHSGSYIAIAVSNYECGVDIEQIKPRDYKKISKRMNFSSNSLEEFYENWTKYEAEYKLGIKSNTIQKFYLGEYIITGVSNNKDELFELYVQSL